MLKSLYVRLMQKPAWLIAFLTAFMLLCLYQIPRLHIDVSSDSLVLQGDQSLAFYRQISQRYKSSGDYLVLSFRPHNGDIFTQQSIEQVKALQQALEKLSGVASVNSYLTVPLLYSPKIAINHFKDGVHYLGEANIDLALAKKEFQTSPIYKDLLSNRQGSVTALQVNLVGDASVVALRQQRDSLRDKANKSAQEKQQLKQISRAYETAKQQQAQESKQLVSDIRAIRDAFSQRYQAKIFIGGLPMIVADMVQYVKSDMAVFGSAALVFIVLIMLVIFRSPRWVFLPMLTCFYTCVYMLGGLALLHINLTIVSANFIALLIILTLAINIHLAVRFNEYQRQRPDLSQRQLVMLAVRYILKPCIYTTTTTMAAFLSLVSCLVPLVMNFGWTMMAGITVGFIVSFLLLPACLLLLPKTQPLKRDKASSDFTHLFAYCVEHHRPALLVLCLTTLALSLWGMSKLKVESRFIDYFSPHTEIYQGMVEIDKDLGGTLPLDIVINHHDSKAAPVLSANTTDAGDDDDFFSDQAGSSDFASANNSQISYWFTRQGMQQVESVQHFLQGLPEVGKVLSLATLYEVFSDLVGGSIDNVQLALIKNNLPEQVDDSLVRPYLSQDGQQTRISLRVKETDKSLNHSALLNQIKQFMYQQGYQEQDFQLTGMMVLYNNLLQSLFVSQAISFVIVFIAIFFMLAYLFKSLSLALAAMIPNVLAAMTVLAMMGFIGFPLDIMTISIASITLGIGVDDTIHYIHRFKKEFAKDGDYIQAMHRCHASIGLAMFYTSLIIIVGFSILVLSNFTPSIYFGFLTSFAMLIALLGALLILPYLIVSFKPFALNH